jgi:thiamine biosynthesis lipoprotein
MAIEAFSLKALKNENAGKYLYLSWIFYVRRGWSIMLLKTNTKTETDTYCSSRQFEALGTINEIRIFDNTDDCVLDMAVQRVYEIDDRMSAFKPNSDVSSLNRNAGQNYTEISAETLTLINIAKAFNVLSDGAFDITVRPLIELWGIGKKQDYIPTQKEIKKALKLVNDKDIITDEKNTVTYLRKSGAAIDLGGIAKGYATDEVKRILVESGIKSAVINLGGNVSTIGARPDKSPWLIGIQNPLACTGEYLGMLSVTGKTIVTSGSNERFFIKDGVRYHHILDPRTGRPAQSGLLSVTAVCDSSVEADALTTAVFVLGMEQGIKLLKRFSADAVFVTEDLKIFVTEGISNNFTMTKVTKPQ